MPKTRDSGKAQDGEKLEQRLIQANPIYETIKSLTDQVDPLSAHGPLTQLLGERAELKSQHSSEMLELTNKLGARLKLREDELSNLLLLAEFHDIGKLLMPNVLLDKSTPLGNHEWSFIKQHPRYGYLVAEAIPLLSNVIDSILSHHERWDGSGYPRGLRETEIPLLARILAVTDAYDAMRMGRSYKVAISKAAAIGELQRCAGTQFDPWVVTEFCALLEEEDKQLANSV